MVPAACKEKQKNVQVFPISFQGFSCLMHRGGLYRFLVFVDFRFCVRFVVDPFSSRWFRVFPRLRVGYLNAFILRSLSCTRVNEHLVVLTCSTQCTARCEHEQEGWTHLCIYALTDVICKTYRATWS